MAIVGASIMTANDHPREGRQLGRAVRTTRSDSVDDGHFWLSCHSIINLCTISSNGAGPAGCRAADVNYADRLNVLDLDTKVSVCLRCKGLGVEKAQPSVLTG